MRTKVTAAMRAATLAAIVAAGLMQSGCGTKDLPSRKDLNVLLVTLDTTRRDHLGCYGYQAVETPHLDRIAREGVLFMNATSPVPLTCPSHSSMLTGLFPPHHGVRSNGGFALKPDAVTLTDILKERGYRTGAFISAYVLNRVFGLAQSFDHYDDDLKGGQESIQEGMFTAKERRGEATVARAIEWFQQAPNEKFFLWVHFYDPHSPYQPPGEYRDKYRGDLYSGEIAYMDAQVGALLDALSAAGVLDRTIIIATGDHGESLGEHDEQSHAFFLYDSTVRIPFMVRVPPTQELRVPSGQELDGQTRVVDIMPTVLSVLELPAPEGIQGVTLLPYMAEKKDVPDLDSYCETLLTRIDYGWSDLIGVRTERWKYVDAPRPELYDLERDPWEIDNLAERFPDRVSEMRGKLSELLKGGTGLPADAFATMTMDEEMRQNLQSLGYLGGSAPEETGTEPAVADSLGIREPVGRDPKDMVEVFIPITKGMQKMFTRDWDDAIKYFSRALAIEPGNKQANRYLGDCFKQKNILGKAEEYYLKTLELDPRQAQVLNNLGALYIDLGRHDEALPLLRRAIEALPSVADAHNNLGAVMLERNEVDQALASFKRAVELDDELAPAHLNLANCYGKKEEWPDAIRELEKVLELQPGNTTARQALLTAKRLQHAGATARSAAPSSTAPGR